MTPKQAAILGMLRDVEDKPGTPAPTLNELVETCGAGASKQAMQCSLRLMEKRNLLEWGYETRSGRSHRVVWLTRYGTSLARTL